MTNMDTVQAAIADGYTTKAELMAHLGWTPAKVQFTIANLIDADRIIPEVGKSNGQHGKPPNRYRVGSRGEKEPEPAESIVTQAKRTQPNCVWALANI